MACDLKKNVERMWSKIRDIEDICVDGQIDCEATNKLGNKYKALSRSIGKIAFLVRDTLTVRDYWYAKFIDDGVLVQPKVVK